MFLIKNISKVNFYCKYHLLSTKNFTEEKKIALLCMNLNEEIKNIFFRS